MVHASQISFVPASNAWALHGSDMIAAVGSC